MTKKYQVDLGDLTLDDMDKVEKLTDQGVGKITAMTYLALIKSDSSWTLATVGAIRQGDIEIKETGSEDTSEPVYTDLGQGQPSVTPLASVPLI